MFGYFWRGVMAMTAVIYTAVTIGISYFSYVEPAESVLALPTEKLPVTPDETVVHVLQSGEESGFMLQQALDLYSSDLAENLSFSVQTVEVASEYRSALMAKLLSGEGADLFQISGARDRFELEGHIRELSDLPWLTNAYPGTLDAVTYNNQIFAVPYSIEGFGLICNRDIFEAADISIAEIRTAEDLTKTFTELSEKISAGELHEDFSGLEAVCEFPAQDKDFLSGGFTDIALSGAFTSPAEAALSQSVDFPAAEAIEIFVKQMAGFSVSGKDWKGLAEVTGLRQVERFANGRVAVILQDTNVYKLVNKLNPKMKGRTFLLPVPLDTFEEPSIYAGAPKYWAINAEADEIAVKAATGFLTWLYRSDEGAEFFAGRFGGVSPFRDSAKSTGAILHSQLLGYMDADLFLPRFCQEVPENWGRNVFAPNVQSYFTDINRTWPEVIDASKKGWDR